MASKINVVARLFTAQEKELLELVKPLTEATRKEKGCIKYEFHKEVDNANSYAFLEQWDSAEDLEAHMKTPHVKAFMEGMKNVQTLEKPQLIKYISTGI